MEKRERPSVMISTYLQHHHFRSSNNLENSKQQQQQQLNPSNDQEERSCSIAEQSTELFKKSYSNQRMLNEHQGRLRASHSSSIASSKILHELNQIKGPSGSIRGHKDVVKKSLENIKKGELSTSMRNYFNIAIQQQQQQQQQMTTTTNLNNQDHQAQANSSGQQEENAATADHHQQQQQQQTNSLTSQSSSSSRTTTTTTVQLQLDEMYKLDYLMRLQESEQDQCVLYTTSLGIIRRTFEDSKAIKSILNLNLIEYEERDIYLNQEYKLQLRLRCNNTECTTDAAASSQHPHMQLPVMFVDGQQFGGLKELEQLNETGQLLNHLSKFKMTASPKDICMCCGNARFIACQSCNGSRKSLIHHFKFNSIALRCIKCNKNDGLVQCPVCCPPIQTGFAKGATATAATPTAGLLPPPPNNVTFSSSAATTKSRSSGGANLVVVAAVDNNNNL